MFLLRAFLVSSSISFRLCSVESKFFDILSASFLYRSGSKFM
ncbi:hypothetical protein LEP1GSC103_0675 [Leptospira borgpetersenii serovar Javanica str. UI 09931]|uniref:Lipoprotein n=1 Tax=Leptospira borgpetersenii serovar Javanica str. UI 09931 TaxID=1049767 RepID=A0AAV3J897_LEPBO|nr:hypothetical protein LEP1GSC103_0675 [Leptospira borgpetersenii serovar Javanica str. UI 09931]